MKPMQQGVAGVPQKQGQSPLSRKFISPNGINLSTCLHCLFPEHQYCDNVTLVIFVQNQKRLCVTSRTGQKVKN